MKTHTPVTGRALYWRLLGYVKPYRAGLALAVLAMALMAATEPLFVALMKPFIDRTFATSAVGYQGMDVPLAWIPAIIIAIFLVRVVAGFCSDYLMAWVGNRVVLDLRRAMFDNLLRLPTRHFADHASGSLISKATYDAAQVAGASTNALTVLVKDSLTALGLLAYMVYANWKLTALVLVLGPIAAWIVRAGSKRLRETSRGAQAAMGRMTHVLQEAIEGHKVVRVFGGQAYEGGRFADEANRLRRFEMKRAAAAALATPLVQLVAALALAVVIHVVIGQATQGQTTVGDFVSYFLALTMLLPTIKRLTQVNDGLQRGLAAAESVFSLIDETPEEDTGEVELGRARGEIVFDHVHLRYTPDAKAALAGVSFAIAPGETVALVGASGSGKTTIANLIPRFFAPTAGRILVDGHDLATIRLASLRANIAVVSQDVVLFNDTVARNIAYGPLADASEKDIAAAAEAAHAMTFIREMPDGLDTLIGERGLKLSGGQRQRIAIARAILKDAPILILDEATSALDTESERAVQEALDALMKNRTTLVIAHRLSTVENADRILVLAEGRVVESGTHRELLSRPGTYAQLHRLQFSAETVQ